MARKKAEGLEALVSRQEPISIQEITMQDWFAAFALISAPPMTSNKDTATWAWDRAESMMEERARRME